VECTEFVNWNYKGSFIFPKELAKLLISSGTTADGRTGRALIGPGKWCALPFPILNAVSDLVVYSKVDWKS